MSSDYHKDLLGFDLELNDLVVIIDKQYSELLVGVISDFTPQKMRVTIINDSRKRVLLCTSKQVLKINFIRDNYPEKFL